MSLLKHWVGLLLGPSFRCYSLNADLKRLLPAMFSRFFLFVFVFTDKLFSILLQLSMLSPERNLSG